MKCLALLKEPWFHAVMANHEIMLLAYFGFYKVETDGRNFDWLPTDDKGKVLLDELLQLAKNLPPMLFVEDDIQFNIMHGELCNYPFENLPFDQKKLEAIVDISEHHAEMSVWARNGFSFMKKESGYDEVNGHRVLFFERAMHPGLNLTYVGHTIMENGIEVVQSHVYIDTGAYARVRDDREDRRLTLINHRDFAKALFENDSFQTAANTPGLDFIEARDALDTKMNGPLSGPIDHPKLERAVSLLEKYFEVNIIHRYLRDFIKINPDTYTKIDLNCGEELYNLFCDYSVRRALHADFAYRETLMAGRKYDEIYNSVCNKFYSMLEGQISEKAIPEYPRSIHAGWPAFTFWKRP